MAKLKAPLFSLEARGALGEDIVFFPWKGIAAVRAYVIPANPQTAAQQTQRGYMTSAVAEWHAASFNADDQTAFNRWAGVHARTMTGFNRFCKEYIDEARLGNTWERIRNYVMLAAGANSIAIRLNKAAGGNVPTIRWGTSKTFFPNSASMVDGGDGTWSYTIPGLTANTLYYITVEVGVSGTDYGRLGIYQQRTAAA